MAETAIVLKYPRLIAGRSNRGPTGYWRHWLPVQSHRPKTDNGESDFYLELRSRCSRRRPPYYEPWLLGLAAYNPLRPDFWVNSEGRNDFYEVTVLDLWVANYDLQIADCSGDVEEDVARRHSLELVRDGLQQRWERKQQKIEEARLLHPDATFTLVPHSLLQTVLASDEEFDKLVA